MATFKEIDQNSNVELKVTKSGLSLAIVFSKEMLLRFGLKHGDVIRLNNAEIIKQ